MIRICFLPPHALYLKGYMKATGKILLPWIGIPPTMKH
nr:MAG TPA: hypothetical protein [Caudoviricetes sp.]